MNARAVILAGGAGTRLRPLTDSTNKHLLQIDGRPMIYYPLAAVHALGATEIMIVTENPWRNDFEHAIAQSTVADSASVTVAIQPERDGIVGALKSALEFIDRKPCMVMLGDNLLENPPISRARDFFAAPRGAEIFCKQVEDPTHFGVADVSNGRVINITEKPKSPTSNLAVIGLYFYDETLTDRIASQKKSSRGEYEITDVNNSYIADSLLRYSELNGWWLDCGSHENLQAARRMVTSRSPKSITAQKQTAMERS